MNKTLALGGLVAAMALAACGGGDDTPPPPPKPPTTVVSGVEGLWSGTTTDMVSVQGVVLENGETWSMMTSSGGALIGLSQGSVQVSGADIVTGTSRYLNVVDESGLANRTSTAVSYSGKYSVRDSMQVTASNGVKFSGTYGVLYEQPATVSEMVGAFSGTGIGNQVRKPLTSLSVSTGGLISISSYPGCSARGTVTPRSSGRNVFDLPLTFVGAACPVGDGTVVHSVVLYNDSTRTLTIMGQSGDKAQTFFYTGLKS